MCLGSSLSPGALGLLTAVSTAPGAEGVGGGGAESVAGAGVSAAVDLGGAFGGGELLESLDLPQPAPSRSPIKRQAVNGAVERRDFRLFTTEEHIGFVMFIGDKLELGGRKRD